MSKDKDEMREKRQVTRMGKKGEGKERKGGE